MKDETSNCKNDSKDDQIQTHGSETSNPSVGTNLIRLGKGYWVDPMDVRSIIPMTSNEDREPKVYVYLNSGGCIMITCNSDEDTIPTADKIGESVYAARAKL